MGGGFGGFGGGDDSPSVIPLQDVAQISTNWPTGNIDVDLGDYMLRPHQKWTITPVAGAGGYPGSPYFKITIAGTNRALAATADAEVVALLAFTGAPEQLWRIDQLTDGTYRIMPKAVLNSQEPLVLSAVAYSTPTLTKFDPLNDKSRWDFKIP
jgi:arabinan endo-1,5-alpha-L-arabinosidase